MNHESKFLKVKLQPDKKTIRVVKQQNKKS
jgi:hypothetical protein